MSPLELYQEKKAPLKFHQWKQMLQRRVGPLKAASQSNSHVFSRNTIKLVHRAHEIFPVHSNIRVCVLLDAARKYSLLAQLWVSLTAPLPKAASCWFENLGHFWLDSRTALQLHCCLVSGSCRGGPCCTVFQGDRSGNQIKGKSSLGCRAVGWE